jgi:hypothetical protein
MKVSSPPGSTISRHARQKLRIFNMTCQNPNRRPLARLHTGAPGGWPALATRAPSADRCGAQPVRRATGTGSFRRALWAEARQARRLPRTAPRRPAACGPRRSSLPRPPAPRPGRSRRAECATNRESVTATRAGTPRIVRAGPSSVKGTRRSFLKPLRRNDLRDPPLSAGDLCQPSGPDGKGQAGGQARSARGEPPQSGTERRFPFPG